MNKDREIIGQRFVDGIFPYPKEEVRALTWKQPFADLMLHGKSIETRTWNTKYRGWVLLCCGKGSYSNDELLKISGGVLTKEINNIEAYAFHFCDYAFAGFAFAIGKLVNCRPLKEEDEAKAFVKWNVNLWAHEYEQVHAINPFEWKGTQGWKTLTAEQKAKIYITE
jgi:hypothetical protein